MAKKIAAVIESTPVVRKGFPIWAIELLIVALAVSAFPVQKTSFPVAAGQATHAVVYRTISIEKPSMLPVYRVTEQVPFAATWFR